MIPVEPKPEPLEFDACVRKPGLSAIAELVGEPPTLKRPGPKLTHAGKSNGIGRANQSVMVAQPSTMSSSPPRTSVRPSHVKGQSRIAVGLASSS